MRPFFQSDFHLAGAQNFEPLTVETHGFATFAFLKGEANEFGDSFWRGGRRHPKDSEIRDHMVVGLDLGGGNREKLDFPTLLIQRDLNQNFFCRISEI